MLLQRAATESAATATSKPTRSTASATSAVVEFAERITPLGMTWWALGAWRYKTGFYGLPLELRAFHRLFRYQRPETAGF